MLERFSFSRGRARFNTITRFSGGVAAATLALAIAVPASAPASPTTTSTAAVVRAGPGPAMWVVQDLDTTIYLFGTFHALDPNSAWFNRSVRAAFEASDQLILETLVPEDPAELHSVISRNSQARQPQVGEPVYADNGSSFVASAGQAMSAGRSMGMSVAHGADAVLRRAANATGKPVSGLETFEFQLQMFRRLPAPPAQAHRGRGEIGGFIGDMQSAWKRGDNAGFAAILGKVRTQSPQTYKIMFSDRNANWAGWIADRMAQPGTVFVAVGTGHLIGPDSVQQQLAARGINSARIS